MHHTRFHIFGIPFDVFPTIFMPQYQPGLGGPCSGEKRKQARERRRWKKIHQRQGRQ